VASPVQRRSISSFPVAYNGLKTEPARGTPMFETQNEWEGQLVNDRFPLLQHLGGTARSAVFLSELRGSEAETKRVIVKLIPANPATASRQLARWSSAAVLSHRNVQRIFQSGRCQMGQTELLYLVMECPDEKLAQVLPQRPLTANEAREMLQPVVDALVYLHGRNLVHGQVKPENILVVGDRLKLSSDHIALAGESNGDNGDYAPPEIARTGVSPAADIWSLGITLVEALTQHLPEWSGIDGEDPELPPELPSPFGEIASNCLRFDPEQRCSVGEIIAHLEAPAPAPQATVVTMPPLASPRLVPEESGSSRWKVIVPVAAVALVVAVLAGAKMFQRSAPQPKAAPAAVQQTAPEQVTKPSPIPAEAEAAQQKAQQRKAEEQKAEPEESSAPASASPVAAQAESPAAAAPVKSPDATPAEVVHQVLPDVPPSARDTITGTVRVGVRVRVDAAGNVVGTSLESQGPSKYFARLAEQAAQQWKFTPEASAQGTQRMWVLRFGFGRTGTEVVPERVEP